MMPLYLLRLIIISTLLPILSATNDYGNHNLNWEDGYASWNEFGHDNSENCNIPKLTVEEWEAGKFWKGDTPVIVKNVTDDWAALTNWKLSEMLRRYPDAEATMGIATEISQQGPDSRDALTPTTVKEFITEHMYNPQRYFFDRKISIPKGMLEDCHPFPMPTRAFFDDKGSDDDRKYRYKWRDHLTISIGADLQGLSFHSHGSAWNIVLFGAKRWMLWERTSLDGTEQRQFSRDENGDIMTAAEWIHTLDKYPQRNEEIKRNGHDCIQHAGELMYIPDKVVHSVVNIGDTVAIVTEVDIDALKDGNNKAQEDIIDPSSGLSLLNGLMQAEEGMVFDILRHHLCPQAAAATSIHPDGSTIDLLEEESSLVSHMELIKALSIAVGQLHEAEAAGELDHLQTRQLLADVGQVAMDAKLIFVECYGSKSYVVNEYTRDLKKVVTA